MRIGRSRGPGQALKNVVCDFAQFARSWTGARSWTVARSWTGSAACHGRRPTKDIGRGRSTLDHRCGTEHPRTEVHGTTGAEPNTPGQGHCTTGRKTWSNGPEPIIPGQSAGLWHTTENRPDFSAPRKAARTLAPRKTGRALAHDGKPPGLSVHHGKPPGL